MKILAGFLAALLALSSVGCENGENGYATTQQEQASKIYLITEENEKPELVFNNQPESSYWFPKQLMEWNASEDADLQFNVSNVPLAKRVDMQKLETVNKTQNKNTKIMAISIMNSSTSGNSPHGLNKISSNVFSYWQYVDTLVYWGGSAGEGLIVPPSPDVTDAAHKNGVKVIGTIFFPQTAHGGKMEWLNDFLQKDASGKFPIIPKLVEVATTYGFDGWFINQETEGTEKEPLTVEHAILMEELIQQLKETAPNLEIIYYDSMTVDGKMEWQNALTDANASYLKPANGKSAADSMFLNFWWTNKKYVEQELLKVSVEKAKEKGIDPYSLYAGVDVQARGIMTPIRWDLFEKSANETYTSLGLYCPSWAYYSANGMEDYWNKENALWVNNMGDPAKEPSIMSETDWRGISTYAVERTAITQLPFITNFNVGNGYNFYKNGELISKMDWNNRSVADIMPTYRYSIKNSGKNSLSARLDVGNAYYGGGSILLRGKVEKQQPTDIKMYSAELAIENEFAFTVVAKANEKSKLSAVLVLSGGSEVVLEADKLLSNDWQTLKFDTSKLKGSTIRTLSLRVESDEDVAGYEMNIGNITMTNEDTSKTAAVSNVKIDAFEFDEDSMYAGVRLSWNSSADSDYYEIYRVNADKTKSFLGVSNTTNFFVNALPRTDETNRTEFNVIPVSKYFAEGSGANTILEWPDNSLPKAAMEADVTLLAPGDSVNFKSLCSENTTDVEWFLQGADTEVVNGKDVSATYSKEGVFNVTVTAKNSSGKADKVYEKVIVVTSNAADGIKLLSQNADTSASSFVNDNEAPPFAVDGDISKKWCATGTPPHELTIDLGEAKMVSAVQISHAEAGGENPDMNTKAYTISVSEDGVTFTPVVVVTRNTAGVTYNAFAPTTARFVKLSVIKPTQGSDSAARIYEVEVFGI